ncbi:Mpo1 family 2-hydroxy fatty acid dioxygenase [Ideonella livida]|uniref:DUF962 domain-containing protein n=1 Tax=Ideonella livida TaxID=2707176 RepID=A0A7C9PJ86_9BURK|nr:Mpo1-like protein [Ideonella livida]NDY93377.1 DUF962 domain-containing protein [Ideonella livida]
MKTLTQQLTQYAAYHRDSRNIATHFVGIPMIVLAVCILLSRPGVNLGAIHASPALAVALPCAWYYLALDRTLGLLMALLLAAGLLVGQTLAQWPTAAWLSWGLGSLVLGWAIQFVGHILEGRKPAFVDDLIGLLIGPLFVLAEALFALGWRPALRQAIEVQVGPVRHGRRAAQA